ncbi:PH domain-containing protein [bacterium]|nr:PH domain-containing protein [bacterium]
MPRFPGLQKTVKLWLAMTAIPFNRVMKILKEEIFYEQHPSMFRNRPVEFCVTCLLCVVLVGFVIFFLWWVKCRGTTLTVSSERTRLRRGILSKSITEVWHQDVRNVQLKQTLFQRLFGVGMIGVSSAGQSGMEISVSGIPDPEVVKSLIDTHRLRRV